MKNIIFLMVMVCLLAGCSGKGQTGMKFKTEVTSEQGLPVKVMSYDEEPLPIKMIVSDKIAVGVFVAFLIVVVATCFAAIAAWRAAYNTRKALEKIEKRSDE